MLTTNILVSPHTFVYPAGLVVVGIVGDDYYLGNRFIKIEEKLGKVMTKEEGERTEKTLGMLEDRREKDSKRSG